MTEFNYTIKDETGLHARPAGLLVKECAAFSSKITVSVNGKTADGKKLFALMGLGVKCGNDVTVTADGADEAEAAEKLKLFFEKNL